MKNNCLHKLSGQEKWINVIQQFSAVLDYIVPQFKSHTVPQSNNNHGIN